MGHTRYPNASMAQLAGRSQEGFERFFFDVCTMDYGKMSRAMDALVDLMNRTDRVRIVGAGTDLSFSIKGIPAVKMRWQNESSGRRGLYRASKEFGQRVHPLQRLQRNA